MPTMTLHVPTNMFVYPAEIENRFENAGYELGNQSPTGFVFGDSLFVPAGEAPAYYLLSGLWVAGRGLTYSFGIPTGGTVTNITLGQGLMHGAEFMSEADASAVGQGNEISISGMNLAVVDLLDMATGGDFEQEFSAYLASQQWTINGSGGSDSFFGGLQADILNGRQGNDSIFGAAGNDTLNGGTGADYLSGGLGSDRATYINASSGVKAYLDTAPANAGEAAGDTFNSIENLTGSNFNDILAGNAQINRLSGAGGNDTVYGYGGYDTLFGNDGNDLLNGGTGKDTLEGNAGRDTFFFNTALGVTNVDTITDFRPADDTIRLENAIFTALTATGTLAASAFKDIATGVKDSNDRIIYNSDTGILYYDRDGAGSTYGNVKFAVLTGSPTLTAADFTII